VCHIDWAGHRSRGSVWMGWTGHGADAAMAEELPGFIPRVLRLDDVSLLRADDSASPAARIPAESRFVVFVGCACLAHHCVTVTY
jgi:hypothetical protein